MPRETGSYDFKRPPFAMQKVTFQRLKCHLSEPEKPPFGNAELADENRKQMLPYSYGL